MKSCSEFPRWWEEKGRGKEREKEGRVEEMREREREKEHLLLIVNCAILITILEP